MLLFQLRLSLADGRSGEQLNALTETFYVVLPARLKVVLVSVGNRFGSWGQGLDHGSVARAIQQGTYLSNSEWASLVKTREYQL